MRSLLAALILVILGLVWWTWRANEEPPAPVAPASTPESAVEPVAAAALHAEPDAGTGAVRVEPPAEVAPPSVPVVEAAATGSKDCEIRGTFLLPGGAPAAGVQLVLHSWQANEERVRRHGVPENWVNPEGWTAADGSFSLRFEPPQAFQFVLEGRLQGHCEPSWRWSGIEHGQIVDVGTVTLVRGGSVRARIVDAAGRRLKSGWTVYGDGASVASGEGRDRTRVRSGICDADGEYLLENLPPGRVELKAYSAIANWIDGPTVDVRAGESTEAEIPYTGPDIESRITVVIFTQPFYIFSHEAEEILLSAPGFETRKAQKIKNSSQSFSFDDVPPGTYTVEVRDPKFHPWSQSDVRPGQRVSARLEGNAAVVLQVLDELGEPAKGFALDVRFDNSRWHPNRFRVLEPNRELPSSGRLAGLVPGDLTLIFECPGYAVLELPLPGLRANETRALMAQLTRGAHIAGRVVQGAKKERVVGARIELEPRRPADKPRVFEVDGDHERLVTSDREGRFRFENVANGTWILQVRAGPRLSVAHEVTIAGDVSRFDEEIQLPAFCHLAGRVLGPAGASFAGLMVDLRPVREVAQGEEPDDFDFDLFSAAPQPDELGADGSFRVGPCPPGNYEVLLRLPDVETQRDGGSMSMSGPELLLGRATLAPETDTRQEFDLREGFPGALEVRARVGGAPASSYQVEISSVGQERFHVASALELDADGFGRSGALLPGVYKVGLRSREDVLAADSGQRVTIAAGAVASVEIDVVIPRGTLRILDSISGAALAATQVQLCVDDESLRGTRQLQTDAQGALTLRLPLGRYRVGRGDAWQAADRLDWPVVEWTVSGPVPDSVRVLPPKQD